MMSSRRTISRWVSAESARPHGVFRRNLLKREVHASVTGGPVPTRSTAIVNRRQCGVASSESEEETQVVSVHQAPSHSVFAMPVRQISSRVPKWLRLVDLTQGDSDAPLPLPPPFLPPPSVIRTWTSRRLYWTGRVLHFHVCCRIFSVTLLWGSPQKLVGPESDSSSMAADGGSVAGSAAGIGVDVDGVQEVPQVCVRAVAVGMVSLDRVNLHESFRDRRSSCA